MKVPRIIAHRTCPPYAPENSLEGMRVAVEQGADAIEVDLRMSLDQRGYLMHDNSMWRTTRWPLPIEVTPSLIVTRLRLRGGSEPPPSFDATLEALPDGRQLAVDVKTPWAARRLVAAIKQRGMEARTLVWCSSALVARYARTHLPGAEVAYYKDFEDGPGNLAFIAQAERLEVGAVSLYWPGISDQTVQAAHAAGLRVYSWHQEWEITAEKVATGLDGLITDHPARARALIQAL